MSDTTPRRIEVGTRHAAHLERLKASNMKQYDAFLVKMAEDVRKRLAGKELTAFSKDRLQRLLKRLDDDFKDTVGRVHGVWREQITDLAQYEAGFEHRALKDSVRHEFAVPSRTQVSAAVFATPLTGMQGIDGGKLLEPFFRDWSTRTITRVHNVVRAGYFKGDVTPNIIRDVVGSRGLNFGDGELARVRRDLETTVRTSLQHAANRARAETWNVNSDIVKNVRIVATLDGVTSAICRSLDGREYPRGEGPRPPFHPNCRTTTVAVLDKRFAALEQGATRRARDPETGEVGYAPANQTYYGWLKNQPGEVQDSIIGPARGALLRNGGLDADRFAELQLNRNFRPATLAEMRDLEPAAFTRAGL